ncbi:MAG: TIGR02584 family CRISPR-associated protein [Deltaproteobacteria bacterium]|nr:MAG: TIGR02584 family CRISPR-associated protein [Deltaproteobacteria bacterium]
MKNILLAVTGLSPQVITETLYALNQMNRAVHVIDIITTRPGKDRLLSQLLDGGKGPYYRYLEEYGIPEESIEFGPDNIHVIRDSLGDEIDDIADENDNARGLATCMEFAFYHSRDPENAVFYSIAGGRKTMGACLTLAAQMYGRPQDRLYHVLVSPEFENNRHFFYPPGKSRTIEMRDPSGEIVYKETKYARINLVHVPFFSIRTLLSPKLLDHPQDPATLMLSLIRETEERLAVDLIKGKIRYRGVELDLMPVRMALYAFFALQKKNCPEPDRNCKTCDCCFIDIQSVMERQPEITALYRRLCGTRPLDEMSDTGILGLNPENFNSYKARIKQDLMAAFGIPAAEKLEIAPVGRRPNTRYGLRIAREVIEVMVEN